MESIVKNILEELYILEPNLRKQEKKLVNIIELMTKNIPKSEMNIEFKNKLRKEILSKIHSSKSKYYTLYLPILSGISLCGVLIFVGINLSSSFIRGGNMISFAPHIEHTSNGAFGMSIKTTAVGGGQEYANNGSIRMMAVGKIKTDESAVINNEPIFEYSYTGKLTIPTGQLIVYKKDSTGFGLSETSSVIRNLHIDGLDSKSFDHAEISGINISEDRDFGYDIAIDFTHGSVNFTQNFAKWPQISCDTTGCETLRKLTEKDIPTNESIIGLADVFIRKYGIDRELYGVPMVSSEWKNEYKKQQSEGIDAYIPESYTVTYPIKIDNQYLYEESSGYRGIVFTIDIRNNRISNVTGIEKYNLIASKYQVLDETKIQAMIQSGGRTIGEAKGSGVVTKITLADPVLGYIRIYGEGKDGISNDFFVPAYIFKVQNKPTDTYIPDIVTIPLVEGFSENTLPNTPTTEPMMR